jgi:hypothetical protein
LHLWFITRQLICQSIALSDIILPIIRSFKTRIFSRWADKTGLSDAALVDALEEMSRGLIDADLGGHIFKKRVALQGKGKSDGARVLVATKLADHWFFILGFGKSERANIDQDELKILREYAKDLLELNEKQLSEAINQGKIFEVNHES